ncbi:hypothetical protein [Oscillatoria sp. FACHB-1406]|uniref:hypothetical protein n=1 Tax=Oscillatoria sp. FACHB-1406 TaxID=2692846 RepID=UPI001683D5E8|nr:hypothetical protein [Oscillatoria sp. FACHB-1406]MBD2576919.1 hypothetical protein [Oscillatoria sp. FACHB-1406]
MQRTQKIVLSFLLSALLLLSTTACTKAPPSRFDQAQKESTQKKVDAVSDKATAGGKFNKFFPKSGSGYQVIYTQEKKGFAEAALKKGGKEVAKLAISDISSVPGAAAKFQNSGIDKVSGYPAANQGSTATAVLVNNRYQVKVLSRDPAFKESDRRAWLGKFNLSGLAGLK